MSITKKDFEKDKFHGREKYNAVIKFLVGNPDRAFRTSEISRSVNLNPNHCSVLLNSLRKLGYVSHKSPFWKINEKGLKKYN